MFHSQYHVLETETWKQSQSYLYSSRQILAPSMQSGAVSARKDGGLKYALKCTNRSLQTCCLREDFLAFSLLHIIRNPTLAPS